jgi:hypothetical protein
MVFGAAGLTDQIVEMTNPEVKHFGGGPLRLEALRLEEVQNQGGIRGYFATQP